MKSFATLFFFFVLSHVTLINAQDSKSQWGIGAGYALTLAPGVLNDNGYGTHNGFFVDVHYLGIRNKFFSFSPGMRLNFGAAYGDQVDVRIPEPDIVIGNVRMTNTFVDLKLAMRTALFEHWFIRPYAEVTAGLRHSSANQVFSLNASVDSNGDVAGASNIDRINKEYSHVYGFGIGTMISVSDRIDIDFRVNRDWVGSLTYLGLDENINSDFIVSEDVKTFSYSIGIRASLNCEEDNQE